MINYIVTPKGKSLVNFRVRLYGGKDYAPGDTEMDKWGVSSESPDETHYPNKILSPI